HLVSRTPLRPEHRIDRAEALQWMFFEQHSIEPNIGAAYFWLALVKGGRELQQHALEDWMEEGYRSLAVMENHLKHHRYFVGNRYSLGDIALYTYAHLAHMCDYDLTTLPEIRAWLERVAAQPGYVPMDWQPENVVAAEGARERRGCAPPKPPPVCGAKRSGVGGKALSKAMARQHPEKLRKD